MALSARANFTLPDIAVACPDTPQYTAQRKGVKDRCNRSPNRSSTHHPRHGLDHYRYRCCDRAYGRLTEMRSIGASSALRGDWRCIWGHLAPFHRPWPSYGRLSRVKTGSQTPSPRPRAFMDMLGLTETRDVLQRNDHPQAKPGVSRGEPLTAAKRGRLRNPNS